MTEPMPSRRAISSYLSPLTSIANVNTPRIVRDRSNHIVFNIVFAFREVYNPRENSWRFLVPSEVQALHELLALRAEAYGLQVIDISGNEFCYPYYCANGTKDNHFAELKLLRFAYNCQRFPVEVPSPIMTTQQDEDRDAMGLTPAERLIYLTAKERATGKILSQAIIESRRYVYAEPRKHFKAARVLLKTCLLHTEFMFKCRTTAPESTYEKVMDSTKKVLAKTQEDEELRYDFPRFGHASPLIESEDFSSAVRELSGNLII